ncbi:MAG: hypothetical protein IPP15_22470 [Saprospiraceae bacterium]|uniref:Uncharacterized protein n=1 Tax=Candidatus Opimibacter skivensis TaxID=2982028 RepID=A0A9D7SZY2_9BACT|nr:hypothetical protein [Candidatus Opimibacter skivensis]
MKANQFFQGLNIIALQITGTFFCQVFFVSLKKSSVVQPCSASVVVDLQGEFKDTIVK